MKLIIELLLIGIIALTLAFILIPLLKKIAIVSGLVDKPNYRKIHAKPVPLVGGIAIVLSSTLALLISNTFMTGGMKHGIILGAGILLMITGSIDDKMDVNPIYRLIIQVGCAYAMASTGTRITSFYGVFGIYDIAVIWQYLLTIIIITGVVNAFNLMDGVDGLAGGLAVVGLSTFSILSYIIGNYEYMLLFIALIGATLGFLKFNLSKDKIFLGDGGSLFLGFILVVSGINIVEMAKPIEGINQPMILTLVIGIFLLPVLDSLRVYRNRIKEGVSPFTADNNHIHHLFLLLGIGHKLTAILIISSALLLLLFSFILINYFSLTLVLILGTIAFFWLTSILALNKNVKEWNIKIRKMEKE